MSTTLKCNIGVRCIVQRSLSVLSPQQVSVAPLRDARPVLCFASQILIAALCAKERGITTVSFFRFSHAAQHGSVRVQWQNRVPAQT